MLGLWQFLHLAGVIVWIGGMLFVLLCLRPAVADLQPQQRAPLMVRALGRFFGLVFVAIALIWISGLAMFLPVGFKAAPVAWHLMLGIGIIMTVVFLVIRARHFRQALADVARADLPAAARSLEKIRALVVLNTILGLIAIALVKLLA